jgi:hypothetical protein
LCDVRPDPFQETGTVDSWCQLSGLSSQPSLGIGLHGIALPAQDYSLSNQHTSKDWWDRGKMTLPLATTEVLCPVFKVPQGLADGFIGIPSVSPSTWLSDLFPSFHP